MTNSEENRVVLGGRRAGKTERLRKWQEEHRESTGEVLGVLTGQVPIHVTPCCPGEGTMAHVRGCEKHPEAGSS